MKDKNEIIETLEKREKFRISNFKKYFAKLKGRCLAKKGSDVLTEYVNARISEFKSYSYSEKNFLISEALDYYMLCSNALEDKPVPRELKTSAKTVADRRENKANKKINEEANNKYWQRAKAKQESKEFLSKCEEIVNNQINAAKEEVESYIHDLLSGAAKYVDISIDSFDFTLKEVNYIV